jgi:hypothetical protein
MTELNTYNPVTLNFTKDISTDVVKSKSLKECNASSPSKQAVKTEFKSFQERKK